jgi:hypothetical protein
MSQPNSLRNIFFLVILFAALVNLVLGGLVLSDSPRRKINRLFVLLSLALSFWGISFLCLNFTYKSPTGIYWGRIYQACLLFVPPLFYHMVLGSIGNPFKGTGLLFPPFYERVKQLAYVFSCGWFVLTIAGVFPQQITQNQLFYFPEINPQFWVAFAVYAALTGLSIAILARSSFQAKDPNQKSRLMYMLLVGAGSIIIGVIFTLFLMNSNWMSSTWMIPMVHVASTLCLVLIAYAFTTTQLYHFSELARKVLAMAVMTLVLVFW